MALEVSNRLGDRPDPLFFLNTLSEYLFDELGFTGNREDYYDPRNSYLNDVLDRRLGIPISLSLVYVEVGKRAGAPLVGVGMPQHFLVRHGEVDDLFVGSLQRRYTAVGTGVRREVRRVVRRQGRLGLSLPRARQQPGVRRSNGPQPQGRIWPPRRVRPRTDHGRLAAGASARLGG